MKNNKKYIIPILCEESSVRHYLSEGLISQTDIDAYCGKLFFREFDTQAELSAYLQALEDLTGWHDFIPLTDLENDLSHWFDKLDTKTWEVMTGINQTDYPTYLKKQFRMDCKALWLKKSVQEKYEIYSKINK